MTLITNIFIIPRIFLTRVKPNHKSNYIINNTQHTQISSRYHSQKMNREFASSHKFPNLKVVQIFRKAHHAKEPGKCKYQIIDALRFRGVARVKGFVGLSSTAITRRTTRSRRGWNGTSTV